MNANLSPSPLRRYKITVEKVHLFSTFLCLVYKSDLIFSWKFALMSRCFGTSCFLSLNHGFGVAAYFLIYFTEVIYDPFFHCQLPGCSEHGFSAPWQRTVRPRWNKTFSENFTKKTGKKELTKCRSYLKKLLEELIDT